MTVTITSDDATFIRELDRGGHFRSRSSPPTIVIGIIYVFLRSVRMTFIPAVTVPIALIGTLARDLGGGLLDQRPDPARAGARDRPRRRRRHRRHREHLAPARARAWSARRGGARHQAGLLRRPVDDRDAGRGVRSDLVLPGHRRPAVLRVRLRAGLFGVALGLRRADAVPMLASRWIGSGEHGRAATPSAAPSPSFGIALERLYARLLNASLDAPMVVLTAGASFRRRRGRSPIRFSADELTPTEDRGFIPISIRSPQGATVDYTAEQVQRAEQIVQPFVDSGEIRNIFATAQGFRRRRLHVRDARAMGPAHADASRRSPPTSTAGSRRSPASGHRLHRQQPRHPRRRSGPAVRDHRPRLRRSRSRRRAHEGHAAATRSTTPSRLNYDTTQPQLSIRIDRDRAADVGVPVQTISTVIQTSSRAATSAPSTSATSGSRSAPWRRRA